MIMIKCLYGDFYIITLFPIAEQAGIERNPGRNLDKVGTFIHTVLASGLQPPPAGDQKACPEKIAGLDYRLWINVEKRDPKGKAIEVWRGEGISRMSLQTRC